MSGEASASRLTPRPPHAPDDQTAKSALKAFLAMDVNGDGRLTLDEFRSGLGTLGMDMEFVTILFNTFDRDGDGMVSKREFLASMAVMLHPDETDQQIGMAFDAYDRNKDGQLDIEEVEHVISALFSTMDKMGIRDQRPDVKRTARELYNNMDVDGKGYVTKEDYHRLATSNPGERNPALLLP